MRITVTGASGFIGSALVPALVAAGHEVSGTIYTRDPEPKIPGVRYKETDLSCRAGWDAALLNDKPEVVFMCAGKTGGAGLDPLHFVTDNALMALQMYRSCAEAGVKRIVYLSSTTGYPDTEEPCKEEDYFTGELHPEYFNPGNTKRFIERLGAMWAHKVETVFIRVGGVYGPGGNFDPQSSHVIEATIRKVAERQDPIIVWGTGENERDALYIDDLTDALIRSINWPSGAYNLGTGLTMSVNDMLNTLLAHADYKPRVERDLSKREILKVRRLDCNKAWMTGWYARTMMPQGIVKTYEWYRGQM